MANTDPWGAMQRRIKALEEENERLRRPSGWETIPTDQFQSVVYKALAGSRNWEDVLHGMRLARDIVRREVDLLKDREGILLGVDDLIRAVESGSRIEYDETRSWRWVPEESS
jgi:hypothetical protein